MITMQAEKLKEAHQDMKDYIPQKYHDFFDVFMEWPDKKLPLQCIYDHAIDLTPDYIPQHSHPYSLNLAQEKALDDFLDENLCKGFI